MANNNRKSTEVDQAEVDALLVEVDFPATRDELVTTAIDADVDQAIVLLFQDLPDDEYVSRGDVNKAINEHGR
jgi:hypothetical protein